MLDEQEYECWNDDQQFKQSNQQCNFGKVLLQQRCNKLHHLRRTLPVGGSGAIPKWGNEYLLPKSSFRWKCKRNLSNGLAFTLRWRMDHPRKCIRWSILGRWKNEIHLKFMDEQYRGNQFKWLFWASCWSVINQWSFQ